MAKGFMTENSLAHISPPHVISLACSRDEAWILDTELGIIHRQDCPGRIDFGGHCKTNVEWNLDHEVSEEEADWRHGATACEISDFFEVLKDQFIQLNWIPVSRFAVRGVLLGNWPHKEGIMSRLQDIYRQHGWPDLAVYRKSECMEAVRKAIEEYPNSYCFRGDV
jgi:hypothetical protein